MSTLTAIESAAITLRAHVYSPVPRDTACCCGWDYGWQRHDRERAHARHAAEQLAAVGALGGQGVRASLDAAAAQREATPGRPEDGPYPASVGEVADEAVAWIDHMTDTCAHNLAREVLRRLVSSELGPELAKRRDQYVHDQVSRTLAHREGDMTRAQIDDEEIAARMRWDDMYPACAVLRKQLGGAA